MNWLIDWLRRLFGGGGSPPPSPPPPLDIWTEMLQLHNQQRSQPLRLAPALQRAAAEHAAWMASTGILTHEGFLERGKRAGYTGKLAENIAMNGTTAEVFAMWMNSAPHKANMLNPAYHDAGFARVGQFWAAIYGGD